MRELLGTLFLGTLFFLSHLSGRQEAYKERDEQKMRDDIEEMKRKFNGYR